MFNKVILVGNLTRDIELKYLPSGTAIANSAIATNRRFKNKMGEQQDETCFIDVSFIGRTAEIVNQYLKKGSKVLIEGRLRFEQWSDQNGQKRSKHSVHVENMQMLDTKGDALASANDFNQGSFQQQSYQQQPQQPSYNQPYNNQAPQMPEQKVPEIDINEDEIPF